jgi:hypothetical protein
MGVAGFDFEFQYGGAQEYELARRLLRHLQRRALQFGLEMHYSVRRDEGVYYVIVDGPLPEMQAFAPRLTLEVFICAEFAEQPKPAWRRTDIAWDLAEAYRDRLNVITDDVHELGRLWTSVRAGLRPSIPSLLFDRTGIPPALHGPLRRFEATLAIYANLPVMLLPTLPVQEDQVLEEAHTATELLLRTALGAGKNVSYAQMADRALEQRWLTPVQHTLLIRLKDLRRGVKHHGQQVKPLAAHDLIMNAADCCHELLGRMAGEDARPLPVA